jgi:syntaxin 5
MKASKDRSEQFVAGAVQSATPPPSTFLLEKSCFLTLVSASSPLYNPIQRPHSAQPYGKHSQSEKVRTDVLTLNMDEEESSIGMPSQSQQMQLVERQNQYLSQRGQAIESIESTIHELGSIFQQLAQMVSEQSETVQRYRAFNFLFLITELMQTQMI